MKEHFSRFFAADPQRLHFAAHSHHPWPDVTYDAQVRAWETAVSLADYKWDHIFGAVVPHTQMRVAQVLGLPDPSTVVFAPSTHALLIRLVSAMSLPIRILTTDAEFHSASRQFRRWEEESIVEVDEVPSQPFDTFPDRFASAFDRHDLVFFSQVHFDSGYVTPDLVTLVGGFPAEPVIVVDGYHSFMAVPTDLSPLADRVFYLGGGYKYAMAGEGAAFLHAPPDWLPRPVDTGWFAGFDTLTSTQTGVPYPRDARRFMGATFDATGVFRLSAVLDWIDEVGLTVTDIHHHVRSLQDRLVDGLSAPWRDTLLPGKEAPDRGNFLTFAHPDAAMSHRQMTAQGVVTDYRSDRWRIGFGIYHEDQDVDRLLSIWAETLDA